MPPKSTPSRVSAPVVPAGAPTWITSELIAETIATWQPYYQERLTEHEATEILTTVAKLIDGLECK